MLRLLGEEVPLRARVEILNGYSAHADRSGLLEWAEAVRGTDGTLEQVWLVHGEDGPREALAAELARRGFRPHSPAPGERASL